MWALDRDSALWELGSELFRDKHKMRANFVQADFLEGGEEEARSAGLVGRINKNSLICGWFKAWRQVPGAIHRPRSIRKWLRKSGTPVLKTRVTRRANKRSEVSLEPLQEKNFLLDPRSTPLPTKLEPLRSRTSVIISCQFLHLFSLPLQTLACAKIAALSRPGTILIGYQQSRKQARAYARPWGEMFYHNAESWLSMWARVQELTSTKWRVDVQVVSLTQWGMKEEDCEWMPDDKQGINFICERLA